MVAADSTFTVLETLRCYGKQSPIARTTWRSEKAFLSMMIASDSAGIQARRHFASTTNKLTPNVVWNRLLNEFSWIITNNLNVAIHRKFGIATSLHSFSLVNNSSLQAQISISWSHWRSRNFAGLRVKDPTASSRWISLLACRFRRLLIAWCEPNSQVEYLLHTEMFISENFVIDPQTLVRLNWYTPYFLPYFNFSVIFALLSKIHLIQLLILLHIGIYI